MKINLALDLELTEQQLQSIARRLGKRPDALDIQEVTQVIAECASEAVLDLIEPKLESAHTVEQVRKDVYDKIKEGHWVKTIPMTGASDRELIGLLKYPHNSIRWARYWLLKEGYIKEGGVRSTGKFWVVTGKHYGEASEIEVSSGSTQEVRQTL